MKKTNKIPEFFLLLFIVLIVGSVYLNGFFENSTSNSNNNVIIDENVSIASQKALFCPEDKCDLKLKEFVENYNDFNCAVYEINLPWFYLEVKKKIDNNANIFLIVDDKQYKKVYEDFNSDLRKILDELKEKGILKTDVKENDYMHNKFCVFDSNLVWLGSFNFTENASKYNNNNVLIIEDKNKKEIVAKEFNEMYSGIFNGGEKTIEQKTYPKIYFCPEDDCASKYLNVFNKAESFVWCMFFSFTYNQLGDKLVELKKQGKDVKIIFESRQISKYSQYKKLKEANVSVIKDKNPKTMHNKFCIVDGKYLITGSMNPSKHSQTANDESIVIINNKKVINKYIDYFRTYWAKWS